MNEINPWKTIQSKKIHETPWISINHHDVINPAGNNTVYTTVNFKNKAIGVLPIDFEGNIYLVGQFRYPTNEYSWEIPEGGGPFEEETLNAAKRELQEETGITANNWQLFSEFNTSNSVTDEHAYLFLAQDLNFGEANPEENEELQVMKIGFQEAVNMILDGKITDSLTIISLLLVRELISTKKIKLLLNK